jgi:multifunctional beta-oxidation protein
MDIPTGNISQANYSAAKMGLIAFTKTLAWEGAQYGIESTVVAPVDYFIVSTKHCR